LAENLAYLLTLLGNNIDVVGCVVASASPFGKKETFFQKTMKTYRIFGLNFFLYYAFKYVYSKLFKRSVKKVLIRHNIKKLNIVGSINSKINLKTIKALKPDLLVSILGNQIFKKKLLDLAPKGCINLHTALLPKYRGLMPTFWVLKNNEKHTGVSVFFVDEGIDSGPIIVQKKLEIGNKTQAELIRQTKKIGMELVAEAVSLIEEDKVQLIPNPESKKTYYSFPTKKDVLAFKQAKKRFY
jgi:methionyl-tRNA formyltransferase